MLNLNDEILSSEQKMDLDYNKIMKIIESCQTLTHIKLAKKTFELFIKKWDLNLSLSEKCKKTNEVNNLIHIKLNKM